MNTQQNPSRLPGGRIRQLVSGSVIIGAVEKLSAVVWRKLQSGFFGGLFTAYDRENELVCRSAAVTRLESADLDGRFLHKVKSRCARGFEESTILGFVRRILDSMLSTWLKVWGLFLFSFALYGALAFVFRTFFIERGEPADDIDFGVIVTLVLMVIASVAMIASRQTLAQALLGSSLACFFLFDVVGIRREALEGRKGGAGRFNIAFIAGTVFGILSFFVKPVWLLIGIAVCIGAYLVLISPEFGVLAILTLLPFLPTMALVAAVIYTAFCYFLKLLCGKRSIRFDLLDGAVLIFMLFEIFGGLVAVSHGSFRPMLVYTAFMAGYFLVVNLIRSKTWLKRCLIGAAASCTAVAVYGLMQNFLGLTATTWQDTSMFGDISGRVVSTFENPNVLAEYLIMCLPLMASLFLTEKEKRAKFVSAAAFALTAGCLVYTWSRGAWLGFLIGMTIFLIMYSRHTLTVLFFGLFAVPFLPFVLPSSITARFLSIGNLGDSSTSYRVYIWRGVLRMLGDFWYSGIGIGTDSFRLVYPRYSLSGIETAPHSHNLFLQVTVELGVFGLIVFLAVLFLYAQSAFSFHQKESRPTKLLSAGLFCGMLAVLAQGVTDYIWYNYRVFLMFWLLMGLTAAVRRVHEATAEEYNL